jgi:hypothetical protein
VAMLLCRLEPALRQKRKSGDYGISPVSLK